MPETTDETFEGWAILELMGHRRLAGYVQEVEIAGAGMLRLDVPGYLHTEPTGEQEERGQATQFYAPGAIYCITPTSEEIARSIAKTPEPVHRWELPEQTADIEAEPAEWDEVEPAEWDEVEPAEWDEVEEPF